MAKLSKPNQHQLMNYLLSNQAYPVPLQNFWKMCGYPGFHEAKKTLVHHFQVNEDFTVSGEDKFPDYKKYFLSLDCAKCLAAMNFKDGNQVTQFLLDMHDEFKNLPQIYQNSLRAMQTKLVDMNERLWELEKESIIQNDTLWTDLDHIVCSYATKKSLPALEVYQTLLSIARENVELERRESLK